MLKNGFFPSFKIAEICEKLFLPSPPPSILSLTCFPEGTCLYDQKLPIRAPPKKHLPCAAPTWVNRCLQTPRKTGAGPCPGGYPTQPQERTQQWLDTQPPGRVPFNLSLPPLPGAAPLLAHGFAGSDSPPEAPHPTTCSPNTLSYPWSPSFPVPVPPPLPHHPLTTASAVLFISACVAPAWLFAQTSVGAGRSAAGAACPWPAACCSAPSVMLLQGWGKGGGAFNPLDIEVERLASSSRGVPRAGIALARKAPGERARGERRG